MNTTEESGYSFRVEGMTCASCVRIVEKNLKKLPGVEYVSVNLGTEKAYVLTDNTVTRDDLAKTVGKAGYSYSEDKPGEDPLKKGFEKARKNIIMAAAVTVPLMAAMIVHMSGIHIPRFALIELAAAAFVMAVPGRGVFRSAWIAGIHLHTNMDSLVALGSIASWVTALLAVVGVPISSFGSVAAMIIAFHLTGRYIEARLKQKASTEIRALMALQARKARVVQEDGTILSVPIESVKEGALVAAATGERIPVDGTVETGGASVDESMVTGESVPVERGAESEVIGGSLVVSGSLRIRVSHTGENTFLAQMIRLVEEAQSAHVPIQAAADKITRIFIPVVFSLAVASGLFWSLAYGRVQPLLELFASVFPWVNPGAGPVSSGIFTFVATLVIACPCALGLAIPMALVTGSGVAASRGLIIRSGEAIQKAKEIQVILLDKTGTITRGEPEVTESDITGRHLAIAAELERNSTHPLAKAVVDYAEKNKSVGEVRVIDPREKAGEGIAGESDGKQYSIGRPGEQDKYLSLMERGASVIEMKEDDSIIGYFAVADPVKGSSREAVRLFLEKGYTPVMITGDQTPTARAVARMVGIEEWAAEVRPDEKVRWVRKYQKQNQVVAMVGDGINDAAALKSADIGIAVGTGTDLAIDSADIIIVQGELEKVLDSITISRATFKKIRQNLFWAFIYNMVAIPLAMSGILYPAIAEAAMMFSSINVIINSLGIKRVLAKETKNEKTEVIG